MIDQATTTMEQEELTMMEMYMVEWKKLMDSGIFSIINRLIIMNIRDRRVRTIGFEN